ncbi:MAG: cysteine methyltransferase [Proteobacteria bacterium ST_bin11]|nr:MAG: cysteine methyltransferase [Proteobacteria bacterium ST_bin11]
MPLHIVWQTVADEEQSLLVVPVLGAELQLTMVGEIITDASWQTTGSLNKSLSPLAVRVQSYLLKPWQTDLHVALLSQGNAYRNAVWKALLAIPFGQVETYSGLAEKLGSGPRAIAGACRNNPYAGLIPCHRVVAKNGIGGFMGQADGEFVALKRRLLDYERGLSLTGG